jgi:hypothetical protein
MVVLARDSAIAPLIDAARKQRVKRFKPMNRNNSVRFPTFRPLAPVPCGRRVFVVEVKTGEKHKNDPADAVDFDYLVYLDRDLNQGAISRSVRYGAKRSPRHFPKDNIPILSGRRNGRIVLPKRENGQQASLVYFGLPLAAEKHAAFFTQVFVAFAEGHLT